MKLQDRHIVGIIVGLIIFVLDLLFFMDSGVFVPLLAIAITIAWGRYWYDIIIEDIRHKRLESEFPNFVRNMVSATKSGMPISQAIVYVARRDYGVLTPYVRRLSNQIRWNISVKKALLNFGDATKNRVIKRAIFTVIEAESAGGKIEDVLEDITSSLVKIEEIKARRIAALNSHKIQNYIIFFVFVGVMILIQNLIIPYIADSGIETVSDDENPEAIDVGQTLDQSGLTADISISFRSIDAFITSVIAWASSMKGILMSLAIIQGFFTGLVIGKTAEGDFKSGIKHSLIMVTLAFLIISFSQTL